MALTEQEKAINRIKNKTRKNMTALGIYKKEFDITIRAYAQLCWQYEVLYQEWVDGGCQVIEEYTNKAGNTNDRKTPAYQVLEILRKDVLTYENTLGLTPLGLRRIKQKNIEKKGTSILVKDIASFES